MLNIYLLRHGETQYNADGNRYCGRTDIELTKKGIQQAELVAGQLVDIVFDGIYSSPLKRAYETARIASGNQPVTKENRLIEIDFGNWEGKTREEFIAENESLWSAWCENPRMARAGGTGETGEEVISRLNGFFAEIREKHPSGNILVVAHNGINRFFLAHQLGMDLKNYRRIVQENSSLTLVSFDENEGFFLKKLNSKV